MWRHWCQIERAWVSVGKGEPCNWCPATESADCAGVQSALSCDVRGGGSINAFKGAKQDRLTVDLYSGGGGGPAEPL